MKKALLLLPILGLAACAEKPAAPLPTVSSMTMVTRLEYPTNAKTVADAARFILRPTGYHLVTQCPNCPPEAQIIADKPISPLALNPQITTVSRALIMIGGSRTGLLVDPDHKAIAYTWAQPGVSYLSQGGAR
ncbi:hypothetical protein AD945_03765 [Gluconobacter albidus]|uniref:Uncharacterized protein n=1 Tax=Gluconobacter albidus TaxID=318683 RepID=A0A149TLM9_9PROT|nr:hypothetical protein [Gluconobacter albidus]KXV49658.1 hypothetical protein AD945_03765 [Gluconobacter albidus]